MSLVLVFFPLCMALVALLFPSGKFRPLLLPFTSSAHAAGTVLVLFRPALGNGPGTLILDPAAKVFLLTMSMLYLFASFYAAGYLKTRTDRSNRFFVACLLASQGFITLVFWSLGLGLGAPALFGTMLHLMTNAMTKGFLFLSAENMYNSYGSKNIDQVRGALRRVPISAAFFLAGFFAITGSPPFGPFASEFSILAGAFVGGHPVVGALFLVFLLLVFIGMGYTVLRVVQGTVPVDLPENNYRETFLLTAPLAAFMLVVLVLGIFLPSPLQALLRDAAVWLGGNS